MSRGGDWITEVVVAHVAAGKTDLPVFDRTTLKLQRLLGEPECEVDAVARLIMSDAALATPVLRIANSTHYRGLEKTLSVSDAIMRLGVKEVTNLVTLVGHKKAYHLRERELQPYIQVLWRHAIAVAVGAQWLLRKLRRSDLVSQGFLAGLLHDVGKLFVLRVLDDVQHPKRDALLAAAPELMASMHTEQGHALLRNWDIPDVFCETVRHHHDDCFDDQDVLAVVVRLTDLAANVEGIGIPQPELDLAETDEARALKLLPQRIDELRAQVRRALEIDP